MQQLLDYIAILAFVVIYFLTSDIFIATAVLMVGVTVQLGAYWLLKKPIGNELKLTFWASIVFGGMTLIFRDETFIQWKPTIVNWLLALVLIGAHLITRTFLIQKMLGAVMVLPDNAWRALTYGWAAGFTVIGAVNLWVAYNFSMDTWVTFKFIGLLGLSLLMIVLTFVYLFAKGYLNEENLPDAKADAEGGQS